MKPFTGLIAGLVFACSCFAQQKQLSNEPLTVEDQTIYRAFLTTYSTGAGGAVNVSDRTILFSPSDMDQKGCLKGMDLVGTGTSVHLLTADAVPSHGYLLVDPEKQRKVIRKSDPGELIRQGKPVEDAVRQGFASGILTLSEIDFSDDLHFAVFTYSFYCGSLCGNGALLIYENIDGTWEPAKGKRCSVWES
ncbi:MAG TPA: hypothetical protein VGF88_09520 [Acidobacteriaceae bacterium]|jgi:hypothetical protein